MINCVTHIYLCSLQESQRKFVAASLFMKIEHEVERMVDEGKFRVS